MKNVRSSLNSISVAVLAILCLVLASNSASAEIIVMFENDDVAASAPSAVADEVHVNASATVLLSAMNTNAGWPDALTVIQNNAAVNSLATAIGSDDYFSFSVTPNAGFLASLSSLDLLYTLQANSLAATTEFSLLSSLTGFTDGSAIDTFSGSATVSGANLGSGSFDITGATALQNVSGGTAIEFRIYAHNTGANSMTRIGIGEAFAANLNSDLVLNGTISAVPEPSSISLFGLGLVAFLGRRRRVNS